MVLNLNSFLTLLILICILLSITNCIFNIRFRHISRRSNSNMLFLTSTLVLCRYSNNTISIYTKSNLNLRNTTTSRHNTIKTKSTQSLITCYHFTLTLNNMNLNRGLIISSSRENLTLSNRNSSISLNNLSRNTTQSFNT